MATGAGKFDSNNEEGWTLLPNGKVLTVNCNTDQTAPNARLMGSEIYNPLTGTWSNGGSTIVQLSDYGNAYEMGPQVLRPDGTIFALGATGNTSIYNSFTGLWQTGPMLPTIGSQLACQDAPGALLPNGDVLFAACRFGLAPDNENGIPPVHVFEFNGTGYTEQPAVPEFSFFPASQFNMLVLPTGQIMMTCIDSLAVYIFTPADTSYNPNWAPIITLAPLQVSPTKTYKITGIRFNGMSQSSMFGDDAQSATNYPLVRITNNSTGHVFYCRTHDHSFMGVASNQKVYTYFDVPANIELGKSTIEVVANGIPSDPLCIFVK